MRLKLLVALLATVGALNLCAAEAAAADPSQATWTPDMCSGPNVPSLWFNNKPLAEWCYQNGYATAPNAQGPSLWDRAKGVITRDNQPPLWPAGPLVFAPLDTTNGGTLPANDDGSTGQLSFPSQLPLFGVDQSSFYINNNGLISLNSPVGTFTPNAFENAAQPFIGPYWADVDTRGSPCPGGADSECNKLTYRINAPNDLDTAKTYLGTPNPPDFVVIVTWYKVGYFSSQTNKLNTFQVMIAKYTSPSPKTYVGFFYDRLEWTTGSASGGTDGLGGIPAYGGYSQGTGVGGQFLNLPGSGTGSVLNLKIQQGGTAAIPLRLNGQFVWDTLGNLDCPFGIQCGSTCLPAGQCCTQPNSCPVGQQCPADGGQCLAPICFPASSTVRRISADRPNTWETVAVPELHIGDTVECLKRDPAFGRDGSVTSAAYGRLGRCAVYGYKKAAAAPAATYTRITFEAAGSDGGNGVVTMSPNHHLVDPVSGKARQAGGLRAGDTVLRASPSGALAPARVVGVATVQEAGAYVPLLSEGGLPIVDGVVAYPSSGDSAVGLDAKHWGQFYLHAPVWQQAAGEALANLPDTGRALADLGAQQPVAAFTQKWYQVAEEAARDGRSLCDWAGVAREMHSGIAQGKVYTEAEALAVLNAHHKQPPSVAMV